MEFQQHLSFNDLAKVKLGIDGHSPSTIDERAKLTNLIIKEIKQLAQVYDKRKKQIRVKLTKPQWKVIQENIFRYGYTIDNVFKCQELLIEIRNRKND